MINVSALIVQALTWRAFLSLSVESNETIRLSLIIAYFISSNYRGAFTFDDCQLFNILRRCDLLRSIPYLRDTKVDLKLYVYFFIIETALKYLILCFISRASQNERTMDGLSIN